MQTKSNEHHTHPVFRGIHRQTKVNVLVHTLSVYKNLKKLVSGESETKLIIKGTNHKAKSCSNSFFPNYIRESPEKMKTAL